MKYSPARGGSGQVGKTKEKSLTGIWLAFSEVFSAWKRGAGAPPVCKICYLKLFLQGSSCSREKVLPERF